MFLSQWFSAIPRNERIEIITKLATACNCAPITIRSYINGNRSIPSNILIKIETFTTKHSYGTVSCRELAIEAAARSEKQHMSKAS